jgi:hypothetical protein
MGSSNLRENDPFAAFDVVERGDFERGPALKKPSTSPLSLARRISEVPL